MKDLVQYLATALVDAPEDVSVEEHVFDQEVTVELSVNQDDLGKIIGKKGRTARALRSIVSAVGAKKGKRVFLDILEPERDLEALDTSEPAPS